MVFNNFKINTGILIRFDDIAPNMNWEMMDKCQNLLNDFNIKPVLGVIPDNKDNDLLNFPRRENFWQIVKEWDSIGWSIAMHGYNHCYDKETNKKDYFNYGGKSEFYGHPYREQLFRIRSGLEIFKKNEIKVNTFFAPNHTYDENTFKALKDSGIFRIIDGYGLMPYIANDIKFIPQLFYKLYILPFGIQSTQIHINNWGAEDFRIFENFIKKNNNKIISMDFAFSKVSNQLYFKLINQFFKNILRIKRLMI